MVGEDGWDEMWCVVGWGGEKGKRIVSPCVFGRER